MAAIDPVEASLRFKRFDDNQLRLLVEALGHRLNHDDRLSLKRSDAIETNRMRVEAMAAQQSRERVRV